MKADISRVEEKYVLTKLQALTLSAKLKKVLQGDGVNGTRPYQVRSLYFDSYWNEDYFDKLDGVENRKKIRLRIYSPKDGTAKLEVKQKKGNNQRKQSLTVTREQAEALIRGDFDVLLRMKETLAQELYYVFLKEQYQPRCIVEYSRTAFQEPFNRIRITLDSDIQVSEGKWDLFDWVKGDTAPVGSKNEVILEVKYDGFLLGYVKDALAGCDVVQEAKSKYCVGRYYGLQREGI